MEKLRITVKFAGQIASDIGTSSKVLEMEKGAKLQTVLEEVDKRTGGRWRKGHIIAVDNEHVTDYNIDVDENSDILVISPMSGG